MKDTCKRLLALRWEVFILVLASLAVTASSQGLADLDWLAGHWVGTFAGHYFESHYTTPEGGMILSISKQIGNGRVTLFEMERFVEHEGRVILTPFPFGKASSDDFHLKDYDALARKARFISPEHDFPTEIIYHRVSPDELRITISGEQNGRRVEVAGQLKRRN